MAHRKSKDIILYDARGKEFNATRAALYQNPLYQPQYRPRICGNSFQDTWKAVDVGTRRSIVSVSRELANQIPNVSAAIEAQAQWVVGDGWRPKFNGGNQSWGDDATAWLFKQWFPIFNTLGPQYDFRQSMKLCSKALITDGDVLMVFTQTKSGFPLVRFIPTHNIGCRTGETILKGGPYDGFRIVDGVVLNDAGRPVAYRITGQKPEDDYYIPSNSCYLLFEPNSFSEYRGIPKLAPAVLDCMTLQDVEVLMQRSIRTSAALGLLHYNQEGQAQVGTYNDPAIEEVTSDTTTGLQTPVTENLYGGDIMYLQSETGDLKEFNSQKPHPNVLGYLDRLEEGMLNAIKWNKALLDPSSNGGAGMRELKETANKSIFDIQNVLSRPFKLAVVWAAARAMDLSIVADNTNDDWYDWDFDYPTELIIDSGNDRDADLKDYMAGITTQRDINAKYGKNYLEIRNQKQSEVVDLYTRAREIHKQFPELSFEKVLNDLSQLTPNGVNNTPQQNAGAKK